MFYFALFSPAQVHYRHAVTNKWTLLAVTSANTDAFTEHILDLTPYFNAKDGLFTQYLRIKPVEYHNSPVMRVAVYGVDPVQHARQEGGGGNELGDDAGACCVQCVFIHAHSFMHQTLSLLHLPFIIFIFFPLFSPDFAPVINNDDVPTISYTIIHSSPRAGPIYVRDGLTRYYKSNRRYYYESDRPRALKRKDFQGQMTDYNRTGWADLNLFFGIDYKDN